MTEERRVDATPPVDDVEIDVVPPAQHPPVAARPSSRPAASEISGPLSSPPSSRSREGSSPSAKRGRGRMAIRIPDDEISRPSPAVVEPTPTTPQVFAPAVEAAPLQPMRIISIEGPKAPVDTPVPDGVASNVEPLVGREDSWTPYQPTTADVRSSEPAVALRDSDIRPPSSSEELIPIESDPEPVPYAVDSAEHLDVDDASIAQVSPAPSASRSPLPGARSPSAPLANGRSARPSASEPDGEDIVVDEDETQRAPAFDRVSEPGEAPEIAPEDLVSVESAPDPASPSRRDPKVGAARGQLGPPTPVVAFVPPAAAATGPTSVRREPVAAVVPPIRAKVPSMPQVALPVPSKPLTPPPPAPPPGSRPPLVIIPPHVGVAPPPSAEAGSRRKVRPWWEDLFNDDYIRTMAKITDAEIAAEADFIEDSLGVAKGGTLLDLACGTGRHAIELSRRGYEVVGFDLSLAMLARAADEAQEREQKLNFVQGDMREMTFDEAFDGVYCWNTSFGFFDEESNAKVVERIRKSLKKGGQFVLDVVNRDFIVQQAPSLAWFEGDGCVCMDEMSIDWITSRMKVKRTMMMDDGRSKEIDYTVRVYSLHELGKILHDQGFRVAEVSGRTATPGVFFGAVSPRTLILAEKR